MHIDMCRRRSKHADDLLCFCPAEPIDVREVLAQPFINGWVDESLHTKAKAAARNPAATQEQLEALLFQIEDAANCCYLAWLGAQ